MARKKTDNSNAGFMGRKGGMSAMTYGAMGAVVGGALGAAGAIILADQTKRQMLSHKASKIRDYAYEKLDGMSKNAQDLQMKAQKQMKVGRKFGKSNKQKRKRSG